MTPLLHRRQVLALLAATWAVASRAAPQDDAWHDSARSRDLPWRLRLPTTPGPWPLLLHSHGLGGGREGGDVWGQAWAAAGFAVVHLQHPGSDTAALRNGLAGLRAAVQPEQLLPQFSLSSIYQFNQSAL